MAALGALSVATVTDRVGNGKSLETMKLTEALSIANRCTELSGPPFRLFLACGFEPLHLRTFLIAYLAQRIAGRRIEVDVGHFGDLEGNIKRARGADCDAVALCIEWADIDPRLDLRRLGGWQPSVLGEIVDSASLYCAHLRGLLAAFPDSMPVAVSLPTLPLPPLSFQRAAHTSVFEAGLLRVIAEFTHHLTVIANTSVINAALLAQASPLSGRLDVKSSLATGIPHSLIHTSFLAEHFATLLDRPIPKKGLITDLDNTLWRGIVGEDGLDVVSWDLEHRGQIHGLYQQTLAALAEAGVLIGVVSKNDRDLACQTLKRSDLQVPIGRIFPVEANWGPKSQGVERVLQAWNIGAESVVYVDDSPWEIAEVQRAFPQMECLRFPVEDAQGVYELLVKLRDLCGKETILAEDGIRVESLKQASMGPIRDLVGTNDHTMLREVEAQIAVATHYGANDPRPLELINKTTQFNLNGRRLTEAEFESKLRRDGALFLMCSYSDKFGPLGRILVLLGQKMNETLIVDSWVLSCRAFSRCVEYAALDYVFDQWDIEEIIFKFEETHRNGPVQEFLTSLLDSGLDSECRLSRERFKVARPVLYHTLTELSSA